MYTNICLCTSSSVPQQAATGLLRDNFNILFYIFFSIRTTHTLHQTYLIKLHCLSLFFCSNINVKMDESERCCVQEQQQQNYKNKCFLYFMCAWQKFVYFDAFRLEIAIFKKAKWMIAKGGVFECTRTTTTKIHKQMLIKLHCLSLFFCSKLNVKMDESERCCVQEQQQQYYKNKCFLNFMCAWYKFCIF